MMKKNGGNGKSSKGKGKGKSEVVPIANPYDFLEYVILEGLCMVVPAEQSLVCARSANINSYSISLSAPAPFTSTNLLSYCCKPFENVDLTAMLALPICTAVTAQACLAAPDAVFIPFEPVGITVTDPTGVCCALEYPTM